MRMELHILFGSCCASTKTNVFSYYHFCCGKPCSEPRTLAGSLLSPFQLGWQGSRSPREEVSPMAWEQEPGEPEGDPTPRALCSGAGSQPCLYWITLQTSPTSLTAWGHFPLWGSFHMSEPFFLRVSIIWIATVTTRIARSWHFGVWMKTFSKSIGRREIIMGALPLTQN